jgi:hypothetical protein
MGQPTQRILWLMKTRMVAGHRRMMSSTSWVDSTGMIASKVVFLHCLMVKRFLAGALCAATTIEP